MIKKFKLTGGLLARYANLVCDTVIPYQEAIINDRMGGVEPSGAVRNFKNAAALHKTGVKPENGDFQGPLFQDSDVAKWIEAASYSLIIKPDTELEARMDELCDLIAAAQEKDGYLNTYFTLERPNDRFTHLTEGHELYCAGHMMEAAVALYEATGNKKLLAVMQKNADFLYKHFVTNGTEGYPGHPEIELALMKLWRATGVEKYRELAEHFINVRGVNSSFFMEEESRRNWKIRDKYPENINKLRSAHLPVRQQHDAVGHAVCAVYLYTAMADIAAVTKDPELEEACFRLFDSISKRRMYITGGIGSTHCWEAFTTDYDLPNDTAYAETCASVGLIFFASKMLKLKRDGRYADVMERALYNTVLAGMELDGTKFFYVNPLEVIPGVSGELLTHERARPQRSGWFSCACCPPNVARLLSSVSKYAWEQENGTLYSNLFTSGDLELPEVSLAVKTGYPFDDTVTYTVKSGAAKLAIRIPAFSAKNYTVSVSGEYIDGYYYVDVKAGDVIEIKLDMQPRLNRANIRVARDSGMGAVTVGPVVYCAEGADNGGEVFSFSIDGSGLKRNRETPRQIGGFSSAADDLGAVYTVTAQGASLMQDDGEALFFTDGYREVKRTLKLIPYFMWGNRGLNQMRVWMPVK